MADLEVQEKDGKIYCPLKKAWHISTPEERVRQYYIAILANKYGYSLKQMEQELKVNNSKRGQGKARADIVIWKNEQDKKDKKAAFIVVECKAENVKVRVEDYYQGFNYASWAHADFFVTTNEKETKYFNVDPAYLPQKLDEVVAIPTDANPRMARTSKMNMIMHGDGHGGVHHHDGLLNVNGIFEERFDVILTNPPFGQNVDRGQLISEADKFTDEEMKKKYKKKYGAAYDEALKQVDDHIGESLLSLYDLGNTSTLTEVLFMERCLRLLKKGGRMGMVLPEGVLNNKNLQTVREYFEGKAKIILICSIPQDVFIAAGATVKPSLVFMRRFTNDEESEYANCKSEALAEVTALHQAEIDKLEATIAKADALTESLKDDLKKAKTKLKQAKKDKKNTTSVETEITTIKKEQADNRLNKKTAEKELKELYKQIDEETKPVVKKKFDYDIPIAKIDDAGITTTGAASEGNQLPQLVDEYSDYRIQNNLWPVLNNEIIYAMNTDGKYCRYIGSQEVVLNEQ